MRDVFIYQLRTVAEPTVYTDVDRSRVFERVRGARDGLPQPVTRSGDLWTVFSSSRLRHRLLHRKRDAAVAKTPSSVSFDALRNNCQRSRDR